MNVNEYGTTYRFLAGESIVGTTPTMIFQPQNGDPFSTTDVTIPLVSITVDSIDYPAGEYTEYTFKEGDLSVAGRWRVKLEVQVSPTVRWATDYVRFTVLP